MSLKLAFVGFRHPHINAFYALAKQRADVDVVAACEEDAETRTSLAGSDIAITHDSYNAMLADVDCDIVACGDYYAVKGTHIIAALQAGKHVIGDKPLCMKLEELDRIESLACETGLHVGCLLDLVDNAVFVTLHRVLQEGAIGEVHTIHFNGQHPLNYGVRPKWYFEEGKHGGTINDIAIHAIDAIPWLTGRSIVEITAARGWNARLKQHPAFQDGGAVMLRLDNGGVVTGDVSYLTPDAQGYTFPVYWRFTMFGSEGAIEAGYTSNAVTVYRKDDKNVRTIPLDAGRPGGCFDDFLADIAGAPRPGGLDMARVFRSSRIALLAQRAADSYCFPVPV